MCIVFIIQIYLIISMLQLIIFRTQLNQIKFYRSVEFSIAASEYHSLASSDSVALIELLFPPWLVIWVPNLAKEVAFLQDFRIGLLLLNPQNGWVSCQFLKPLDMCLGVGIILFCHS